ncbi:hypothetical protein JCM11251_003220, partial [Rhodosporidiobolus azoricus]
VASGIWIKINKRYDPPKQAKVGFEALVESRNMLVEKAPPAGTPLLGTDLDYPVDQPTTAKRIFLQYVTPCLVAVGAALLLSPWMGTVVSAPSLAGEMAFVSPGSTTPDLLDNSRTIAPLAQLRHEDEFLPSLPAGYVEVAEATPTALQVNRDEEDLAIAVEGGSWDTQLHAAISPACKSDLTTQPYRTDTRTGFVSFPRSGNSYLRSLVERATGYQTSSIYCDLLLMQKFAGECDHEQNFFVKTHWPALDDAPDMDNYYRQFDQVVHVIRNPLDAIVSWFHYDFAARTEEGYQSHEAKVDVELFGEEYRSQLMLYADRWKRHTEYWMNAPVLTHTLRYEALKAQPIPNMSFTSLSFRYS